MTIVSIGPVTKDLIIRKDKKESKTGGAVYFQSFVFDEFYPDYLIITNCSDMGLIKDFPDKNKVKLIEKDETHFFINDYPNNDDFRIQSSNFAKISIAKKDLEKLLPENIDAFIINPLNAFDFPKETIDYLKSFNVPIYMSLQGFLRYPNEKIGDNYSIKLKLTSDVKDITSDIDGLFLDESEALILFENNDYKDFNINEIIITNGSKGSRVISDDEYKIEAVKNDNVIDSTGCGDTYMAAYISKKLTSKSILKSANFASKIASDKLSFFGPFKSDI
ncbi:MAG: ribokinase [Methanobrevibacter sp.]|uniref:Ribokinase n=1 Tax=Methanobrevibacter millerae TaxID=230361 RepID=A0A8T3VHN6_9EURY|nr:PfkB family carbohydrate kinase [Methanobrevibacter millerae]MBE6505995.1 ribokinase [Methanobrevibacter millerae]MBR0058261.1 ribokinase [Methanobrevibacter sp.]